MDFLLEKKGAISKMSTNNLMIIIPYRLSTFKGAKKRGKQLALLSL